MSHNMKELMKVSLLSHYVIHCSLTYYVVWCWCSSKIGDFLSKPNKDQLHDRWGPKRWDFRSIRAPTKGLVHICGRPNPKALLCLDHGANCWTICLMTWSMMHMQLPRMFPYDPQRIRNTLFTLLNELYVWCMTFGWMCQCNCNLLYNFSCWLNI